MHAVAAMSFYVGVCDSMLTHVEGMVTVTSRIVKYKVDSSTEAAFVVDPDEWVGWQDAGAKPADVVGAVRDAVEPAVEAAKVVLDKIKEIHPGTVEVKFGISVSGGVNWGIAKAAAEGSFEVTLSWSPDAGQPASLPAPGGESAGA